MGRAPRRRGSGRHVRPGPAGRPQHRRVRQGLHARSSTAVSGSDGVVRGRAASPCERRGGCAAKQRAPGAALEAENGLHDRAVGQGAGVRCAPARRCSRRLGRRRRRAPLQEPSDAVAPWLAPALLREAGRSVACLALRGKQRGARPSARVCAQRCCCSALTWHFCSRRRGLACAACRVSPVEGCWSTHPCQHH